MRVAFSGVPRTRIIVFWGLYLSSLLCVETTTWTQKLAGGDGRGLLKWLNVTWLLGFCSQYYTNPNLNPLKTTTERLNSRTCLQALAGSKPSSTRAECRCGGSG